MSIRRAQRREPAALTRHLQAHGWRVTRYRDGMLDVRRGQAVRIGGVAGPLLEGEVEHLDVTLGFQPHSAFPHRIDLQRVTVRLRNGRTMCVPGWLLPGNAPPAPPPAETRPHLRLVAGD